MSRKSPLGLLLVGLLWGGIGAASEPPETDHTQLTYWHGFAASGHFAGTCNLTGIRYDSGYPGNLTLTAAAAQLTVYQTRINQTVLLQPFQQGVALPPEHSQTNHTLTGPIRVTWEPGAHVALSRESHARWEQMNLTLDGTQWDAGPAARTFYTGAEDYFEVRHGQLSLTPEALWGPAFALKTNAQTFNVSGRGFLKLDTNASVDAAGVHVTLPPFRVVEWQDKTAVYVRRTILETYAVVAFDGLASTLGAAHSEPACLSLDWMGTGTVAYRTASGNASRGAQTLGFDRREFTLNGTLRARDEARTVSREPGAPSYVQAEGSGQFDALGLDFLSIPVPVRAAPLPLVEIGAGIGILALLAWFYSRLVEDPLAHPARALILQAIREHPGLVEREVGPIIGLSRGVVRYHLAFLRSRGVVRAVNGPGRARYLFPKDSDAAATQRKALLERDAPLRALVEILRGGARPQTEVVKALRARLDYSRVGTWKVLRRALARGIVERRETPKGVLLSVPS